MKKNLLLFFIISTCWGTVFSQKLVRAPFELRSENTKSAKIASAENYFEIGYCTDDTPVLNGGLGQASAFTATCLIKIPASTMSRFVGDSICAANIGISGNVSNVVAVVRETADGADIASKTFNAVVGWNQVKFDDPVTIENKDYYVGYTITLAAGQYAIGISNTDKTEGALILADDSGVADYTSNFGALCVKALLLGDAAHFSNIASITNVNLKKYQPLNTSVDIPVSISNKGVNEITSLDVTYKYADKDAVTLPIENLNIAANTSATVTIPQVTFDVNGNIDFTVTKINGEITSSNTLTKSVFVYDAANEVPHKALLEQFTTEKCVYCPAGAARIKTVLNKAEYKNKVIWMAHHAGYGTDSYTISASSSYLRFYGGSTYAPAMMVDRSVFDELNMGGIPVAGVGTEADIESYVAAALNVPCFTTVNISQNNPTVTTDNKVNITVSGEYKGTLPTEDLYAFVYLSEDSLKSTSQTGYTGTYTHNNVIRASLNGTAGKKITWSGNNYTVNFTATLNANWKKENMNVTAIVAKNYTNAITNVNILNAERQPLSLVASGLDNIYAASVNAYFQGGKIVIGGEYTSMKVYNIDGKEINNNNLNKGIYIVKINNLDKFATKKVAVY